MTDSHQEITITVNPTEAILIRAALEAVAPTGGGSDEWSLYMKVMRQTATKVETPSNYEHIVTNLMRNVLREAVEAGITAQELKDLTK